MRRTIIVTMTSHVGKTISVFSACLLSSAIALQSYSFQEGDNVTMTFHHELTQLISTDGGTNNDVQVYYLDDFGIPILFYTTTTTTTRNNDNNNNYKNGIIYSSKLKPDQRGRFQVNVRQRQRNVTTVLQIRQARVTDGGIYIMKSTENLNGSVRVVNYNASMDVIPSSGNAGNAECNIDEDVDIRVRCSAAVDKGDGGEIVCYQNSSPLPNALPVAMVMENRISAEFLVDPGSDVSCCVVRQSVSADPSICNDFVSSTNFDENDDTELAVQVYDRYSRPLNSGEIGVIILMGFLVTLILSMAVKDTVIDFIMYEKWKKPEDRKKKQEQGFDPLNHDFTFDMESLNVDVDDDEEYEITASIYDPDSSTHNILT